MSTYAPSAADVDSAGLSLARAAAEYPNADYTPYAHTIGKLRAILERAEEDGPERTIQRARAALRALEDFQR